MLTICKLRLSIVYRRTIKSLTSSIYFFYLKALWQRGSIECRYGTDFELFYKFYIIGDDLMEALKTYKSQIILVTLFAVLIVVGIAVS